jgi:hypothetical protein
MLVGACCAMCPGLSATEDVPDWPALVDLHGRELRPFADAQAKALALVYILPDCPIGNSYLPELNRLNRTLADRGVQMVLVHADSATSAERARQHAREYGIEAPVVLDPRHAWVRRAGVTVAPEAAVFSPSGELLYRGRINNQYAGLGKRRMVVTQHDLKDALEAILAGRPVKEPRTQAVGCLIPEISVGQ